MSFAFAPFETAIGDCAIAWSSRGVVGVQLPEASQAHTRARIAKRFPGAREAAPSETAARAIADIAALLAGEARDLGAVTLDLANASVFERAIYALARAIPPGATRTYGELARASGDPGAARAVGQVMANNPFPIIVPCHRVLAANGKMGGFSAYGGARMKQRLLEIEGWRAEPSLFDALA